MCGILCHWCWWMLSSQDNVENFENKEHVSYSFNGLASCCVLSGQVNGPSQLCTFYPCLNASRILAVYSASHVPASRTTTTKVYHSSLHPIILNTIPPPHPSTHPHTYPTPSDQPTGPHPTSAPQTQSSTARSHPQTNPPATHPPPNSHTNQG